MFLFVMDIKHQRRLAGLLRQIRGEQSIRSYCLSGPIKWSAWRGWEALDTVPTMKNLEIIAGLAGWDVDQLLSYLRTGNPDDHSYDEQAMIAYLRSLPLERRHHVVSMALAE